MATRTTKIINLVLAMRDELIANPAGTTARTNQRLAIAAVTGGVGSTAWETYMRQFVSANDQEQLMRLLATDGTDDDEALVEHRAYLVSNGVCGEGTRLRFAENVKTIDKDLPIAGVPEVPCEPIP